jgi:hypothetical protein
MVKGCFITGHKYVPDSNVRFSEGHCIELGVNFTQTIINIFRKIQETDFWNVG